MKLRSLPMHAACNGPPPRVAAGGPGVFAQRCASRSGSDRHGAFGRRESMDGRRSSGAFEATRLDAGFVLVRCESKSGA